MSSLGTQLKQTFSSGSVLTRLIFVNVAVFLIVNLIRIPFFLFEANDYAPAITEWLAVPSNPLLLLYKPWTIITYMFLHENFMHIFSNMLMLFFGGQLFMEYLGEKRLLGLYILGGIAGAFLYIIVFNLFPVFSRAVHFSYALGASAAVLAIFVAISTYIPHFVVNLFFVFRVKLMYVAIGLVIIDLISIDKGNPGGHIAHLGGSLFGFLFSKQLQKGNDFSLYFSKIIHLIASLFTKKNKVKVVYTDKQNVNKNKNSNKKQQAIDAILDKISKAGYESLNKEEKEILFNFSKEN